MSEENSNPEVTNKRDAPTSGLSVEDLAGYLTRLAHLYVGQATGNMELECALRQLASALKPYGTRSVAELSEILKHATSIKQRAASAKKIATTRPSNVDNLPAEEVERVLGDENYTKIQLIELGARRLGISRSKLTRLGRKDVVQSITAALDHERSLEVISQEARRGGERRSS